MAISELVLRFSSFELRPERGQLLNSGVPVALGSRALAILTLLAERAGVIVTVSEITDHVWPNLFVQENNLRVHLSAIRRVFRAAGANDVEIINVPGRGYRLHAEVTKEGHPSGDAQAGDELRPATLPLPINRLIGRSEFIASVVQAIADHRLVTVVGPGGIGKTSVALAASRACHASIPVCFIDLTNCTSVEHVTAAAAAALQSPMGSDATPAVLMEHLRNAEVVLLLDNCEHLIDIIARVAETVLQSCPRVKLIATSREPLRVPSEVLLHLQPLSVPAIADPPATIADSSAVALFVERAKASAGSFSITADNAQHIGAICRSLDGLPLALELAAAAVPIVGIDELSTGLTQRLSMIAFGRRTLARHETLDAMLDWSFELLPAAERDVLCSLGCFRSSFDLDAAIRVGALDGCGEAETAKAILQLAAKSLLVVESLSQNATYRLLETTKVYARRKLDASGQANTVARRHAEWVASLLACAKDDWLRLERAVWWERYGQAIDDVRAALTWALGGTGDSRLGVSLTLASAPLWIGLSQFAEYNDWLEQALTKLTSLGEGDGAEEIQLQIGLCVLLFNADRPGDRFVRAATQVKRIGEMIGDPIARATGLWLLAGHRQIMSDYRGALALAREMLQPENSDPSPQLQTFAKRVIALMTFRAGQLAESAQIGAELIADLGDRTAYDDVLRYDHYTVARSNHALTLAVQGKLDAALNLIMDSVADSARLRNPASFCYLLSSAACPVALWSGDDGLARHYADLLAREAAENRFTYMGELATWYSKILDFREMGQVASQTLPGRPPPLPHDKNVFITTCTAFCDVQAVNGAESTEPHWATAEILRAFGEIQLSLGETAAARALFARALSIAEAQGSWLWALRAATSIAPLVSRDEATATLTAATARVEDAANSPDLRAARTLLSKLAGENTQATG